MIGQGNKRGDLATRRPFALAAWTLLAAGACAGPAPAQSAAPTADRSDYARAVVAYINENEPITRQELGEYLIARYGTEKIELLVNRRVIEVACRARGIEVTAGEVEAALGDDLK